MFDTIARVLTRNSERTKEAVGDVVVMVEPEAATVPLRELRADDWVQTTAEQMRAQSAAANALALAIASTPMPPVPEPEVLAKKPEPIDWNPAPQDDLADYMAVCDTLGYEPEEVKAHRLETKRRELMAFMISVGIPIYDNKEVHKFMDDLVAKINRPEIERENRMLRAARTPGSFTLWDVGQSRVHWHWVPLSPKTQEVRVRETDHKGRFVQSYMEEKTTAGYSKPIPVFALKHAATIKERYPTAVFEVTDYYSTNPDPFLSVSIDGCERVVFAVWDEPGFGIETK